jgi:hypothetical protein
LQEWLNFRKSSSVESRVRLGRRRFRQASGDASDKCQKFASKAIMFCYCLQALPLAVLKSVERCRCDGGVGGFCVVDKKTRLLG